MIRRVFLGLLPLLAAFPASAAGPPPTAAGAAQQASFVRLPVINANLIRSNRSRGVISLESGVDAPDPKVRARVQLLIPRLKADLTRRLALYTDNLRPGFPPNLDVLVPQLQKQVDQTVGQPGARLLVLNVLIN
ncbi:MAG: Tat pathway signal protein [Phenylobacterium sp.]